MSPTGKMYVTITSSANGTDLFQINTDGSLTHLKNMGSYGTIGQLDFYQLPGGGGHYGFSSGEYVSKDGIDRIYFSQGAFDTDSDGNGSDIATKFKYDLQRIKRYNNYLSRPRFRQPN